MIESLLGSQAGTVRLSMELDAGWHGLGGRVQAGAKRSPIRSPEQGVALAEEIARREKLELVAIMAYEGQISGVGDEPPNRPVRARMIKWMQKNSIEEIAERRTEFVRRVKQVAPIEIVNGGGTGSLEFTSAESEVTEVAAHHLAPIIQNGFPFDERMVETVRSYCAPLKRADVDTLILGCTHYPLIAPMLQRILGRDVRLVTAGHAIAAEAQRRLEARGLESENSGREGSYRFICTGDVASFHELGTRFLQMPLGEIERVEIA